MQRLMLRGSPLPSGSFDEEQAGLELTWRPEMDVFELPAEFVFRLSMPGVRLEDVDVTVDGKALVVSGERRLAIPEGAIAHLLESKGGRFERWVRLPANADVASLRIEMSEGQLVMRVPKAEPRLVTRIEFERRGG
jgi:HSP20 family protein